jgi:hypothetical protein
MKTTCKTPATLFAASAAVMLLCQPASAAFDLDNGNAPIQLIIPNVIPVIFRTVSPGDAPLVLRTTTLITNSWFDAVAPYDETAVGVYSRLGNRPPGEHTDRNRNIACLYSSHEVLLSLYPELRADWDAMLASAGLDPADDSTDATSAIGIGNAAGKALVAAREQDGMNQLGDLTPAPLRRAGRSTRFPQSNTPGVVPRDYNLLPYADYTGYKPVNTAYELNDPGRWQPAIKTKNFGIFTVQQFVTPQWARTRTFSGIDPTSIRVGPPVKSNPRDLAAYKAQADEVLAASAAMTDEQKMIAELFDNKITSLGFSALFASTVSGLSLEDFIRYDFLTNIAAFDTGVVVWQEKTRYDAVRPFSAIAHIYGANKVTAWGGPFQGTVNDIPANEWTSYLSVADHPEYPSGSSSFCAAHAEVSRRFFGTDTLNWSFPVAQGTSVIEPGFTPQAEITLTFPTWTDFAYRCGMSRFWGGVHFKDSIPAGAEIGNRVADKVWSFYGSLLDGSAPAL